MKEVEYECFKTQLISIQKTLGNNLFVLIKLQQETNKLLEQIHKAVDKNG